MRTTLTIDDDIAKALKQRARENGVSFKAIVNDVLRRGLSTGDKPPRRRGGFKVEASHRGFCAGIDIQRLNQLVDDMETEAFLAQPHEPEK